MMQKYVEDRQQEQQQQQQKGIICKDFSARISSHFER
jgi:hypothetical protein